MDPAEVSVLAAAVALGALVQGSLGFGLSLIAVPVFGIVAPSAAPATILLASLPLTVSMAMRERGHVDRAGVVQITLGRIPGTLLAVWILSIVSGSQISVVIGAAVIVAVAVSVLAPEFETGAKLRGTAGVMSGLMGTVAAVGGPPLALVYQRRPGAELRSTLALAFAIGSTMSLVALALGGHVEDDELVLAGLMVPALALGLAAAARLHRWLDRGWLRPAVLTFAAISGGVAMLRGLVG